MGKGNKSGLALLIGAAAGAVAGYWLNTTQGKLWRKKTMEQTKDFREEMGHMSESAREKAKEFGGNMGTYADKAKEKATHFAQNVKEKAKTRVKETEDFVVNKASSLADEESKASTTAKEAIKEGIEKAKSRLSSLSGEFSKN